MREGRGRRRLSPGGGRDGATISYAPSLAGQPNADTATQMQVETHWVCYCLIYQIRGQTLLYPKEVLVAVLASTRYSYSRFSVVVSLGTKKPKDWAARLSIVILFYTPETTLLSIVLG